MRILFVCGVDTGGAPRSTLALARRLSERGHRVGVILGSGVDGHGRTYTRMTNAAIKLRRATGATWPRELLRRLGPGARPKAQDLPCEVWRCRRPENAVRSIARLTGAELIVANSLPREQMRWIVRDARELGIPVGVYLREEHSITHLTLSRLPFDLVLANSEHLAAAAVAAGYEATMVPSVVELGEAATDSTRRTAVLVNPVQENRPEILRRLAGRRPDIECVLQESWTLPAAWRAELESWTRVLPGLRLEPPVPRPSDIYRDARVLVAPYPTGRPRVVLEAQTNGIPVVAADQEALEEAVGTGGVLVRHDAPLDAWVDAIARLWDDADYYASLCAAARTQAARPEVDPDAIVTRFEHIVSAVTG